MSDDRVKLSPALHLVANEICILDRTDGFCMPRNHQQCHKCWPAAEALLKHSGFSGRALAWILRHRNKIEEQAANG